MKIILSEVEIRESIQEFIKKTMTIPDDKVFVIDVSSSRGVGVTAEITIENKVKAEDLINNVVKEEPREVTPIKIPFTEVEEVKQEVPEPPKKSFFANLA